MPSSYPLVYGLHDMQEYRERTIQSVGIQVMEQALQEWAMMYQETTNRFLDAVAMRDPAWNVSPVLRTRLPYGVDYQIVDEDGKADPVMNYLTYDVGLPLVRGELATGWSWERMRVLTVNDINDWLYQVMVADSMFFRTMAKKALFYNVGWNFLSSEEDQNIPATIPIVPLANGDAQTYPLKSGGFGTATHYTAQAGAVSAADPFPTIYNTMTQYSTSNLMDSRLVAFVNGATLKSDILALDDFHPYNTTRYVQYGNGLTTVDDTIRNEIYFGDRALGEHAVGIVVVEWQDLPANYIVTMDMGQMPLGIREKAEPALQGIIGMDNILGHYGNEQLRRIRRIAGMAVVNRTAAHIHFVSAGDTTYDVPTGYTPVV